VRAKAAIALLDCVNKSWILGLMNLRPWRILHPWWLWDSHIPTMNCLPFNISPERKYSICLSKSRFFVTCNQM
jgi:hypothetical protein